MNKGMKVLYTTVMLCALLLLASCGGKKLGNHEVVLNGDVVEKGDQLIIKGESNLLEGARVNGQVFINEDELFADATELVDNKGNFTMEMEHPLYGEAIVRVTFNAEGIQEEEILEHYGENAEKLKGPYSYLIRNSDPEEIKKEARVELMMNEDEDETTYTFTKPEWDKRPDDYGDPRVWMEIDEVTNDGEFFYITGRSNLVEGTKIRANHYNSAETMIHPDGSFDVKLEYKYEEDKPIVMKFSPAGQWGNVLDAYGEHGEKLVGNLVVQDGNTLYLEYPYEYEE